MGLQTLTTTACSLPSCPPRRMVLSVPSMASTAVTVPLDTTTHWPISRRPDFFGHFPSQVDIGHCSALLGFRWVQHPASARSSGNQKRGRPDTDALIFQNPANARRILSSWVSCCIPAIKAIAFRSGRISLMELGFLMAPIITASVIWLALKKFDAAA